MDFFVLGEGMRSPWYIASTARAGTRTGPRLLGEAARIPGIYVPPSRAGLPPRRNAGGDAHPEGSGAPELVRKRVVEDMNKSLFPVKTIIPSTEIVHDRVMELFGAVSGCRFCQAEYVYRPVRSRVKQLAEYGKAAWDSAIK